MVCVTSFMSLELLSSMEYVYVCVSVENEVNGSIKFSLMFVLSLSIQFARKCLNFLRPLF